MTNRARIAVVVAAVGMGSLGCHYARTETPPPPPPPPPVAPGPICTSVAVITYVPGDPTFELQVSQKQLPATFPAQNPGSKAVCWYLDYGGGTYPFEEMKIEGIDLVTGQHGRRVLVGDLNFRGQDRVKAQFDDEPNWPSVGAQKISITYTIVGRLRGASQNLTADPEVVIQKNI